MNFYEYGTPSQREKQLEDTGSLEIPIPELYDAYKMMSEILVKVLMQMI